MFWKKSGCLLLVGLTVLLCFIWLWIQTKVAEDVALDICRSGCDISQSGNDLVFTGPGGGGSDLYLLKLKELQVKRLTQTDQCESEPAFVPNSRKVLYCVQTPHEHTSHLFVLSLDTLKSSQLTTGEVSDSWPALSRDGSQVVFVRAVDWEVGLMAPSSWKEPELFTMNTDGTHVSQMTRNHYLDLSQPRFLGDDQSALFMGVKVEGHTISQHLYRVPLTGNQAEQKLEKWLEPECFAVSPDGTQMVFGAHGNLFVMDLQTSHYHQIMDNAWKPIRVVFTPEGNHVICIFISPPTGDSSAPETDALWEIDLVTGKSHQIASSSLFTSPLEWNGSVKHSSVGTLSNDANITR